MADEHYEVRISFLNEDGDGVLLPQVNEFLVGVITSLAYSLISARVAVPPPKIQFKVADFRGFELLQKKRKENLLLEAKYKELGDKLKTAAAEIEAKTKYADHLRRISQEKENKVIELQKKLESADAEIKKLRQEHFIFKEVKKVSKKRLSLDIAPEQLPAAFDVLAEEMIRSKDILVRTLLHKSGSLSPKVEYFRILEHRQKLGLDPIQESAYGILEQLTSAINENRERFPLMAQYGLPKLFPYGRLIGKDLGEETLKQLELYKARTLGVELGNRLHLVRNMKGEVREAVKRRIEEAENLIPEIPDLGKPIPDYEIPQDLFNLPPEQRDIPDEVSLQELIQLRYRQMAP